MLGQTLSLLFPTTIIYEKLQLPPPTNNILKYLLQGHDWEEN